MFIYLLFDFFNFRARLDGKEVMCLEVLGSG